MEQHPVPQQISAYEFRLVGDMTIKQFGQVAGGVVIGLVFYALRLPFLIKLPLVALPIILGAAMAFLPIEERPIQTWIIAFFKAVYSPTQYIWRKVAHVPEVLAEGKKLATPPTLAGAKLTPKDQKKLASYLFSLPQVKSEVEIEEKKFLEKVQKLFASPTPAGFETGIPEKMEHFPKKEEKKEEPAGVKVRKLHGPLVMEVEGQEPEEKAERLAPKVVPAYTPQYTPMPKPTRKKLSAKEAEFGEIPMPSTPTIPNIIVGMVTDREGKIMEGAIIEIRDEKGNPVRAFKTGKLGQFQVVTPLTNGNYEIEVEKENHRFDLYKFRLEGKIMEPIRIRAR